MRYGVSMAKPPRYGRAIRFSRSHGGPGQKNGADSGAR